MKKNFIKILSLALTTTIILGLYSGNNIMQVEAAQNSIQSTQQERKVIAYFAEWAHGQQSHKNYTADMMPWEKITHINYAFARVNMDTNKIDFGDKAAAIEREFPGQTKDFPYKGHFNVINSYKKKYPNVKSLIAVGGWADSRGFYTMAETQATRDIFADSCVEFIRNYGFDGLDIDYEYPTETAKAGNENDFDLSEPRRKTLEKNYVELMKTLRIKLDEAGAKDGKHYLLSAALPASSWILGGMGLGEYAQYLDYANLMTYDFHGGWNGVVGHNAPLYPDSRDPESKDVPMPVLNIDWAYRYFRGVLPPEKINIGIPYYTRGWKDVKPNTLPGGLYGEAAQTGGGAIGEDNIWHDKDKLGNEIPGGSNPLWHAKNLLNNPDYKKYFDSETKSSYIWNDKKKVFLSMEDEESLKSKLDYVIDKNLGGVMIWEIDGDYDKLPSGEYTVGDTLTTLAYDTFKNATPLKETIPEKPLPSKNFKVDFKGSYAHPNYTFDMTVTNNTKEVIAPNWKLEFDLPKSCYLDSAWGMSIESKPNGDFNRYTVTGPGWKSLGPGESHSFGGMIKLCFAGGPRNFTLNGFSSEAEVGKVDFPNDVKPLAATISSSVVDSNDGNYDLTVKIPANSNATGYKIFENGVMIKEGSVDSVKESNLVNKIVGNQTGIYEYTVELNNIAGNSVSNKVSVKVINNIVISTKVGLDFALTNNWGGATANYGITLKNDTGKEIRSWEINFDSLKTISNCWDADMKVNDNSYTFVNKVWATPIAIGKSVIIGGVSDSSMVRGDFKNINIKTIYSDGTSETHKVK